MRKDYYSAYGNAWSSVTHEDARNKAYRWGEDVKELYYFLDSTPSHSYLKMLHKYPQVEFPYESLPEESR